MMDLRCEHRLHGRINGGILEVVCRSTLCGKRAGVVVVHYFDLKNGKYSTRLYKDPGIGRKDGLGRRSTVRIA